MPKCFLTTIGLNHPLDGITNLEYKLLCFLTPNNFFFKEKSAARNSRKLLVNLEVCNSFSKAVVAMPYTCEDCLAYLEGGLLK
jgi:hypothetical protein